MEICKCFVPLPGRGPLFAGVGVVVPTTEIQNAAIFGSDFHYRDGELIVGAFVLKIHKIGDMPHQAEIEAAVRADIHIGDPVYYPQQTIAHLVGIVLLVVGGLWIEGKQCT